MEKRYIGIEELAQYLQLSKNTLYAWVNQRKLPYFKVGHLVRFDLQEIEAWMARNRVKNVY